MLFDYYHMYNVFWPVLVIFNILATTSLSTWSLNITKNRTMNCWDNAFELTGIQTVAKFCIKSGMKWEWTMKTN